eukprot:TRINITY_DN18231_c0_g1_i1.p1 TRINITY_DN18231_c0_g1~~TRINITY_DN18231_c0_g1_i1.p1  ORF type:complete len:101 (-),score=27.57 TRINITY_DN18231_c0_g1_i1:751-1053(-)
MFVFFFFLMIRRPPRSTLSSSSAASDVYKRQAAAALRSQCQRWRSGSLRTLSKCWSLISGRSAGAAPHRSAGSTGSGSTKQRGRRVEPSGENSSLPAAVT